MRLFLTMRKNTARKIRAKAIEIKGGFHYQTKTQCVPTPPPRCNYIWYLGWTLQAVQKHHPGRDIHAPGRYFWRTLAGQPVTQCRSQRQGMFFSILHSQAIRSLIFFLSSPHVLRVIVRYHVSINQSNQIGASCPTLSPGLSRQIPPSWLVVVAPLRPAPPPGSRVSRLCAP